MDYPRLVEIATSCRVGGGVGRWGRAQAQIRAQEKELGIGGDKTGEEVESCIEVVSRKWEMRSWWIDSVKEWMDTVRLKTRTVHFTQHLFYYHL